MLTEYDSSPSKSSQDKEVEKPQKRIRTIEHVEGNFPSYVYVKVLRSDDWDIAREKCRASFTTAENESCEEMHVSLTPLMLLRHHFILPFVEKLRSKCEHVSEFECHFDDAIDIYANEEKTRYFAAVPVSDVSVSRLTRLRNAALEVRESFPCDGLPLPREIRFHVSLASSLSPSIYDCKGAGSVWPNVVSLPPMNLCLDVERIYLRAGKRDYFIDLKREG